MLHMRPIVLSEDEVTDRLCADCCLKPATILMTCDACEADITKNLEKVRRYMKTSKLSGETEEIEEKMLSKFSAAGFRRVIMETFGIQPCRRWESLKTQSKRLFLTESWQQLRRGIRLHAEKSAEMNISHI